MVGAGAPRLSLDNNPLCANPMFGFRTISKLFPIQTPGYEAYVRFPKDFHIISHTNLRLHTVCLFAGRFLGHVSDKSEVTNLLLVILAIVGALCI